MAYEKTWQFDTNRLYNPASTPAPYILTAVFSAGGGTLATQEYWYAVTAIKNGVESVTSSEFRINALAGGTITLTWTAIPGATAYTLYRGTSSLSYGRAYVLGNVTTFTDTTTSGGIITTNVPLDQSNDLVKYSLWYYKAFITGQIGGATQGLWTVVGSSDGVTGAMDGVDRWTSTYDSTKLVNNSAGLAHSWIVLRSPVMAGQTYHLLIDWSGSVFYYSGAFSISPGAAPTGGSNTAAPVMPNPAALPVSNSPFIRSAQWVGGPSRFHGQLATDGSFNILSSRHGTRRFINGFLMHLLANYRGIDGYPVWMSLIGDSLLTSGYGTVLGANGTGPDNIANAVMRTPNNNSFDNYALITPQTSNWPAGESRFDMSFDDYPLWVAKRNSGNGFIGARGRLQDITFVAGFFNTGDGPESGSLDSQFAPMYMNVGNFRFPIDQRILWS